VYNMFSTMKDGLTWLSLFLILLKIRIKVGRIELGSFLKHTKNLYEFILLNIL
jgi:hypothetical protein